MIHETAIVSDQAKIGEGVTIGPYCVVKGDVTLADGVSLDQFVSVGSETSQTFIGEGTKIFPGAVVGGAPQDLKYNGEKTKVVVGKNNVIREFVTINAGTPSGGGITTIGDQCLLMAYVHVAHDCHLGSHVVIANSCQLAGHVEMEDHVKVGGVCCFNQFVRLGLHSYVAGDSAVNKDVLPFSIAQGKYAVMRAANQIGMERSGYPKNEVDDVRKALRIITKGKLTVEQALERIREECGDNEAIRHLIEFTEKSERGIAL